MRGVVLVIDEHSTSARGLFRFFLSYQGNHNSRSPGSMKARVGFIDVHLMSNTGMKGTVDKKWIWGIACRNILLLNLEMFPGTRAVVRWLRVNKPRDVILQYTVLWYCNAIHYCTVSALRDRGVRPRRQCVKAGTTVLRGKVGQRAACPWETVGFATWTIQLPENESGTTTVRHRFVLFSRQW